MIRVAVVDDHPAIRLGLDSALRTEPGLVPVGSAAEPEELPPLLYRTRPDVVLLDYHLPRHDGLSICQQIKADVPPPAVLLYSAYADAALIVPAIIAGADGIVHKNSTPTQLFQAIRVVAKGGTALPPLPPALLEAAGDALDPDDLPILGMLINHTPRRDIADALQLTPDALGHRIAKMLNRLKTPLPRQPGASAMTDTPPNQRTAHESVPDKPHVGRLSRGTEARPDSAPKRHRGRFNEGIEQRPDTPRKRRPGRFSDGLDRSDDLRPERQRGSFADIEPDDPSVT